MNDTENHKPKVHAGWNLCEGEHLLREFILLDSFIFGICALNRRLVDGGLFVDMSEK